ncbi:MAG TPA: helix-turn-helix transcriptional regulator [Alphaproteobacteria bacterium]|nr:helix-turn-helix transcriptional regulator [Alphaproteobacteria bacterium]
MNNQTARNNFYSEMGFRLKQIRQIKGVSQNELAEALGVVTQTIQKYESGEIRMLPEIIHKCAQLFQISVGYFYGETNQKKFSRSSLMIAAEAMMLPSDEVRKNLYSLIKSINHATEQDNKHSR